jgi:hypothetical protein
MRFENRLRSGGKPPNPSAIPSTHRCRASFAAESALCRAFPPAAVASARPRRRPIERTLPSAGTSQRGSFDPHCSRLTAECLELGTGVEPVTARSLIWCSTAELTGLATPGQNPCAEHAEPITATGRSGCREDRAPLDGRRQRSLPSNRRRWESNPLQTALQAVADPSGSSVVSIKCPRQESNLVLDLRRIACAPAHPEDVLFPTRFPAEESNLVGQLRTLPCFRHTRRACLRNIPTWNRTRTWTFGRSNAIRYTIGTQPQSVTIKKSRRLDSHQHEPVYKTGAFLSRATSAN